MKNRRHRFANLTPQQMDEITRRGSHHHVCKKVAGVARPGKTAYERSKRRGGVS